MAYGSQRSEGGFAGDQIRHSARTILGIGLLLTASIAKSGNPNRSPQRIPEPARHDEVTLG
jgi:hypothetical protein